MCISKITFKMKYLPLYIIAFLLGTISSQGKDIPVGNKKDSYMQVTVNNISVEGDQLVTDLTFNLSKVKLKGSREVIITPMFVKGYNVAELEPFTIAGRNRWYSIKRNHEENGLLIKGWKKIKPGAYDLESSIKWEPWMSDAELVLKMQEVGCANCPKKSLDYYLAETEVKTLSYNVPEFIYVSPIAEAVKMREISARAYIDFPVGKTQIDPKFRRNPYELAKIKSTIDSVRNDKDISVRSLHISGTASPEGSYETNVKLAKGRTEALKNYVQKLYAFPSGFINTSYVPVDWAGLAEWLQNNMNNSAVPHASSILNIVNSNIPPQQRNQNIKSNYPKEYQWLLTNVYPSLRHSDYKIEYEIKSFTEVSEILSIMETSPQKLSLAELFVAADSQPEGSNLYNRAFELAVMMYPNDETANLNAGIAAIQRSDFVSAQRYLAKAGNSDEAKYARGVYSMLQNDYAAAKLIFSELTNSLEPVVAEQSKVIIQNMNEVEAGKNITWKVIN